MKEIKLLTSPLIFVLILLTSTAKGQNVELENSEAITWKDSNGQIRSQIFADGNTFQITPMGSGQFLHFGDGTSTTSDTWFSSTLSQTPSSNVSMIIKSTGRVGIGTSSPEAQLQVNGNLSLLSGAERMLWSSKHEGASDHRNYLAPRTADNTAWDWGQEFGYHHFNRAWYFDGNVGIGTSGPDSKLEVRASLSTDDQFETVAKFIGYRGSSNSQKPMLTLATQRGGNTPIEIGGIAAYYEGSSEGGIQILTKENGTLNPQLTINKSGSVGIGTESMFGYRLAVNGTIGSTEVKVENTSPWPDFVFRNDYKLLTLEQVEQHINENGHLPEIPSESEVTENGINLGEMDSKLLMKIEELTLYMIDMNKRMNQLEQENSELKESNQELKEEISTLKSN